MSTNLSILAFAIFSAACGAGGAPASAFSADGATHSVDATYEPDERALLPEAPTSGGCHTVTYTPAVPAAERAELCLPATRQGRLAVVLVHGGGSVQGSRAEMLAWQEFFVAAGAVTLNIDYFLVAPSTPAPVFPRVERNLKAAVQYLRGNAVRLGIDPGRVLLLGTSAGARLGGIVLTTPDDPHFAGAGLWPGVSDRLDGFLGFYGGYGTNLLTGVTGLTPAQYYGGEPSSADPAVRERYAKADSAGNAAAASGPVILFHGEADTKAPVMQSIRFDRALAAAGKDSTLVTVPGAEHSFDRAKTRGRPFTAEGRAAADRALAWIRSRFP